MVAMRNAFRGELGVDGDGSVVRDQFEVCKCAQKSQFGLTNCI